MLVDDARFACTISAGGTPQLHAAADIQINDCLGAGFSALLQLEIGPFVEVAADTDAGPAFCIRADVEVVDAKLVAEPFEERCRTIAGELADGIGKLGDLHRRQAGHGLAEDELGQHFVLR